MLSTKIPLVAKFLAILRVSYELESDVYSGAFRSLKDHNVPPVDMDSVIERFLQEVRAISKVKQGLFNRHPELSTDQLRNLINDKTISLRKALPCIYQK